MVDSGGSRILLGGGGGRGAPCPRDGRGGDFEPRQLRGSVLVWMGRERGVNISVNCFFF